MAASTKEDIRALLEAYHGRIHGVIQRAWDEWRALATFMSEQGMGAVLYDRTIANHVFDAIARHAISEFASDASVNIKIEAQTVKFIFNGQVLARFKKGDDNKLGRNVRTQASLAFIEVDGIFPGLPPETAKVEFVWLPNDIHTKLDEVLVVARDGNTRQWEYAIGPEAGGEVIAFEPEGPAPMPDQDDIADDGLVLPKKPSVDDADEQD